jgi:uncharacterized protein
MNNTLRSPGLTAQRAYRALPAFALLLALPVRAQVASFDCSHAGTPTERAICATPALGRKDVTVTTYYQLLLRLKPATAGMAYREFDDQVRDGQRQWLQQERDACKDDIGCLNRAYDKRMDALLKTFDANAGLTFGRSID